LRRGLKDSNCGSLTGERSGAWRRAPLQRCLGETPFRGALESRRPPKIRKREPDAWAAETDGTRECERGGRYGRPFFFLSGSQTCDRPSDEKADRDQRRDGLDAHRQLCSLAERHRVGRAVGRRIGQREVEIIDERRLPGRLQPASLIGALSEQEVERLGELRVCPREWPPAIEFPVDESERERSCPRVRPLPPPTRGRPPLPRPRSGQAARGQRG
jgi:hypothetical protein